VADNTLGDASRIPRVGRYVVKCCEVPLHSFITDFSTETPPGSQAGFRGRHSAADIVFGHQIEVFGNFVVDLENPGDA
jgi:hypothetical protein